MNAAHEPADTVPPPCTCRSGSTCIELFKRGAQRYQKTSYPSHCGIYHSVATSRAVMHFNLNHEIIRLIGKGREWPHPQEWLKRTITNDWIYYSTGGYTGVYETTGEFYLPNLPYLTNNHLGGKPLHLQAVADLVDSWRDIISAIGSDNARHFDDLADKLEPAEIMGSAGFSYGFTPKRPGVYHFVMEPQPYWEPIEDRFIIHYTKTVVAAFGAEENWMQPLGLPAEIRPLLRPFGNYQGNSFTGQVLIDGKAAGGAEVEVEYYDRENNYQAPTDYHITQVITADDSAITRIMDAATPLDALLD